MATRAVRPMDQPTAVLVRLDPGGPVVCGSRSPFLRADDLGVLRGDGVFERFLVDGGSAPALRGPPGSHGSFGRLAELELPARAAWREAVAPAVEAWQGAAEWEMRLVCTRGPEEGGPPYRLRARPGARASRFSSQRQAASRSSLWPGACRAGSTDEAPWLLLGAKTLSYAVNMAAKRWAESRGADDAIFVGATAWSGRRPPRP